MEGPPETGMEGALDVELLWAGLHRAMGPRVVLKELRNSEEWTGMGWWENEGLTIFLLFVPWICL